QTPGSPKTPDPNQNLPRVPRAQTHPPGPQTPIPTSSTWTPDHHSGSPTPPETPDPHPNLHLDPRPSPCSPTPDPTHTRDLSPPSLPSPFCKSRPSRPPGTRGPQIPILTPTCTPNPHPDPRDPRLHPAPSCTADPQRKGRPPPRTPDLYWEAPSKQQKAPHPICTPGDVDNPPYLRVMLRGAPWWRGRGMSPRWHPGP
ncbi:hypothetical protein H1C71_042472, partial [Ictidomys tridecemlineatus]